MTAERKSGGLLGIRSLVRRRPVSAPRGGGAPQPQTQSAPPQMTQRRRMLGYGGSTASAGVGGGHSSSLPAGPPPSSSRKRPAGPPTSRKRPAGVASSAPPHEHLRRPPSSRRTTTATEFGSQAHLGIGARPRSGSDSQPPRGGVYGRSAGGGGGGQSRQPRPQPSRQGQRHGGSRTSRDASVVIVGGGGRGANRPAVRPHVPSLRERGQRAGAISSAPRPQLHDPAALQRMREESRRRLGFTSSTTTSTTSKPQPTAPLRGESQRKVSGSIVVSKPPTAADRTDGTNRRRRSKTLDESNRTSSSNSKLSSVSTVSEVSASKAQPTQVETVRQQSLRTAHLMPTISSAKLHVVSEVDSSKEKSPATAQQCSTESRGTGTQQVSYLIQI